MIKLSLIYFGFLFSFFARADQNLSGKYFYLMQTRKDSYQRAFVSSTLNQWCKKKYRFLGPLSQKDFKISLESKFFATPQTLFKCNGYITIIEYSENSYEWVYTFASASGRQCEPVAGAYCTNLK